MRKFTIMVPVEVIANEESRDQVDLWRSLKDAGGASFSSSGEQYVIRTEKILLRDFLAACKKAKAL